MNLSEMSNEQLKTLQNQITTTISERRNAERATLVNSDAAKKLKERWKRLEAEGEKLSDKISTTILVPLKITAAGDEVSLGSCQRNDLQSAGNLLNLYFTGEIDGTVPGLTPKQREMLKDSVSDYVDNACREIMELFPREVRSKWISFAQKCKRLRDAGRKVNIGASDITG